MMNYEKKKLSSKWLKKSIHQFHRSSGSVHFFSWCCLHRSHRPSHGILHVKNMDTLGFEPRAFRTGFVALYQVRQTCFFFGGANPAAAIHLKRRHEICCHAKWRIAGWACIQWPSCIGPGHLQNSNRSVQVVKEVAHSLSLHGFCARYAV